MIQFTSARKFAVALFAAALMSVVGATAATAETTSLKDEFGNVFVHNEYVSTGLAYNAHFGSCTNANDCVNIPEGFPNAGNGRLGFYAVADILNPNWSDAVGDFFTPGSPYEGWMLRFNGSQYRMDNGNDSFNGAWEDPEAGSSKFTWVSSDTSQTGGLRIKQTTRLIPKSTLLDNTITITNEGSDPVTGVYYGRSVDPDNCVDDPNPAPGDRWASTNKIGSQNGVDGANRTLVTGSMDCGGTHQTVLGLASRDEGAVVCNDCWGIGNLEDLANNAAGYPAGAELTDDTGIGISIPANPSGGNTLAPGQTVTLHFAYFLNMADADKAGYEIPDGLITVTPLDASGGKAVSSGVVKFKVTGEAGHTYQVSTSPSFKTYKVFATGADSSIRVAIPGYKKGKVGVTKLYVRDTADPTKKTVIAQLPWDFSIPWVVWGASRISYFADGKTPNPGYWDVAAAVRDTAAPGDTRGLYAELSYSKSKPSDSTPFPGALSPNKVVKFKSFRSTVRGAKPPKWIRVADSWGNKSSWHGLGNMPSYPDTTKK